MNHMSQSHTDTHWLVLKALLSQASGGCCLLCSYLHTHELRLCVRQMAGTSVRAFVIMAAHSWTAIREADQRTQTNKQTLVQQRDKITILLKGWRKKTAKDQELTTI